MADPALVNELSLLYGFLPDELLAIFIDAYVEFGDVELATAAMRQAPAYERYFAGNRRADGTVRMTEGEYASYRERFRLTIASINVNPDLFSEQFVNLVAGDVSPDEFLGRVESLYERVIDQAPAIKQTYAQLYGIEMTDSAILASVLDPEVGRAIIERRISIAEVGGEAALRGFGIELLTRNALPQAVTAEELVQAGVTRQGAQQVFGEAANQLPILDILARRHDDPDDDFDINEFLSAAIFDDPEQRRRIRRLVAAEQSMFTQGRYLREQGGGVIGLVAR